MFLAYSNKLGCGGSLVVSLLGSVVLIVAMFGLNSCLTRGAPLVVPGPEAAASVGEAIDAPAAPAEEPRTVDDFDAPG